jgi:hypothetical protein
MWSERLRQCRERCKAQIYDFEEVFALCNQKGTWSVFYSVQI